MAVRSGAGTGVVVALVVFVLTTVFLLVMTIVFYRGQTDAQQTQAEAEAALAKFVKPAERSQDTYSRIESMAQASNQSVVGYMQGRFMDLMTAADGPNSTDVEAFRTKVDRLSGEQGLSLFSVATGYANSLGQTQTEIDSKNRKIADREDEIDELREAARQAEDGHRESLAEVQGQLDEYAQLVQDYNTRLSDAIQAMEDSVERLRLTKDDEIDRLENEKDQINQQLVVVASRLAEFQARWDEIRERGKNPALLVDGRVIDASGSDQVFIDRGRRDRIVLGMTFEVYDDEAALIDPVTRQTQPGKASIQVIKVGETTSTCAVTRHTPGRPVVRQDIIANAVYDPRYEFSFLVHGTFEIDGDGSPTPAEAEYLRSLVHDWGGRVVTGTELPGDLDFLVLGVEPPEPAPLPASPTDVQVNEWLRKKQNREDYLTLFNQAREAQIPILNSNRFLILIGYADR